MTILIVDIGNTRTKIGVFEDGSPIQMINSDQAPESAIEECFNNWKVDELLLSTVRDDEILKRFLNKKGIPFEFLDHLMHLPIELDYRTPQTLGRDRIAAAVGAWRLAGGGNALVIDAGTCITYDWVTEEGVFLGGNIAPGLQMRWEAMHEMTHRLPLARPLKSLQLKGKNTNQALYLGGALGVLAEVEYYHKYTKWSHFELYLTGGAGEWISKHLDLKHHYEKDLVIKGLYEIFAFNHK